MKNPQDTVRPADYDLPQVSAKQSLTALDMNMPRLYGTRWILCFPLDVAANKMEVYNNLRAGLAQTILRIPFISGKLAADASSNSNATGLAIVDGDSGVRFKYNDLTAATSQIPSYAELKAAHFPLSKLSTAQLSPLGVMPDNSTPAVMAAQANFIKGGLLLTVCAHHSACDAVGLNTVLQTWAELSFSAAKGRSLDSVDPMINNRQPLMTGRAGAALHHFPEYILAPTPPVAAADVTSHQMAATPFQLPDMTARIFSFSKLSLVSLKTAAGAYSTNDAVQALVWRHITLARAAASAQSPRAMTGNSVTALLYAANMRGKVSPPLPHNYTGNASIANMTRHLSVDEMRASDGLKTATAAIRSSLGKLNDPGRVGLLIGLLSSRPDPSDFKFAYNGFLGPDLSSTSWADLSVFDMEWGGLGRPEAFRIPGEGADGSMIILPKVQGGLEVVVALESRAMKLLLADREFKKWAEEWA